MEIIVNETMDFEGNITNHSRTTLNKQEMTENKKVVYNTLKGNTNK